MIVSSVKLTYLFSTLHNSSTSFHLINNFSYSVCRDNHLVENLTNILFHHLPASNCLISNICLSAKLRDLTPSNAALQKSWSSAQY
ncbi:hypothetical protein CJ20_143 [Escherichia phage CJ20]|nr:hypothetical protein CJ20_143 [Escherichia phage CJ20]